MKRIFAVLFIVLMFAGLAGVHAWNARAASSSCTNSFPADGHVGPWHTPENGGTLHGNTVKIDCPTQGTAWDVNYGVQYRSNGNWLFYTFDHKTGTGDFQFSESLDHSACTDTIYAFPLRTHIGNNVTGGNANKPSGGSFVTLC